MNSPAPDFRLSPQGRTANLPEPSRATESPREYSASVEENERRLLLAEAAGQIGTWEWDPDVPAQLLSPELHRLFGTDPAGPDRYRTWAARVYRADWPRVQKQMDEARKTGNMEFEYRYEHPENGLRWLYCKGRRYPSDSRMFGIVQDITARKIDQQAAQRLAAIVEYSDDAIVSKDLNGIVTSWNPGAERMFGYTAQEMVGRSITTIIPPELHHDEERILDTIAQGGRIEHFETVRLHKSGARVDISLTVSPVKDQEGRIVGAAKIARDITERKKAEQSLLVSERLAAVGRLAATVAHEINNPLEAVTNLVYLAKMSSPPGELLKYLSTAEEQLNCISHLTRQTLGFYRETSGARRVRLSEIITSLASVFASRARNRRISLVQEIDENTEIVAVPGEIRQVIANLVSNSIDAIPGAGSVRIRVSPSRRWTGNCEGGVRITIADDGAGIPREARGRLFEPFFTTKRDVGTGLGLWVCKTIVNNHRGTIQVHSSTTRGKSGTAVSVFLPCEQPAGVSEYVDVRSEAPRLSKAS